MIRIFKNPKPKILEKNAEKWTNEYLEGIKNNNLTDTIKYRYHHKEIKEALIEESHGKCVYCESKLLHISFGDIEHILSKSIRPELYVDWDNLILACEECNRTNKHDYYSVTDPLINPVKEDPSEYLVGLGATIFKKPGNRKGEITIKILDLNRTDLIERRMERIKGIEQLVDKYVQENNPDLKEILKEELLNESSVDKEYSFVVKEYLKEMNVI